MSIPFLNFFEIFLLLHYARNKNIKIVRLCFSFVSICDFFIVLEIKFDKKYLICYNGVVFEIQRQASARRIYQMDNILNTQDSQILKKSKRNSMLELYRFLFALWVVWYHGFFIFKNEYFASGYLAVEFFFFLSGFYFLKSLDKYKGQSFLGGLLRMLWDKIKPLGIAFIVGLVFVLWQRILEGQPVLLGYLWYIPIMLLAFIIIYTLRRLISNNVAFACILVGISVVCFLILYIPISEKLGVARGIGSVSLGVLLSFIPKVNWKINRININAIIVGILFAAVAYLAYLPKDNLTCEYLLVFLLMPMLIYFTSTVSVSCKLFDFLGSLSFALYAYQCILRVVRMCVELPQYYLFLMLIVLVAADRIIAALYSSYKRSKPSMA